MMADRLPKFAVVSHILPPATSGQSVILQRLLSDLPADRYVVVSREAYPESEQGGAGRLPVTYHQLRSAAWLSTAHQRRFQFIRQYTDIVPHIRARAVELRQILEKEEAELVIACTGDLYDLPAAALAASWLKIPFVPYMFDDYLYQWTGAMRHVARLIEPWVIRQAAAVIGPNEFLAKEYKKRYGIAMEIIRNLCPIPELQTLGKPKESFNPKDTNIVYAGSVYHAHFDAFRNLVMAMGELKEQNLKLHIYTMQKAEDLANEGIGGDHVVIHEPRPQAEILPIIRAADWLFLPLAFHSAIPEVIKTSAPGKLGEYLALERPILVHAPADSFISWYLAEHDCGLVVGENDPAVLTKKLGQLLADKDAQARMSKRARAQAQADFAPAVVQAKFIDLLERLGKARQ